MALPAYATPLDKVWHYTFLSICGLIFFFLIAPIVIIVPLSFNAVPFFTFTPEMLSFDPAGYSTKWYQEFFTSLNWLGAVKNSFIIAIFATLISTTLGTIAALGLSRSDMPYKS
jgi:putative spermidine/putrescine transport system permease protein